MRSRWVTKRAGATIFEGKGDCLSCHRVGQEGPRGSVDLTSIGTTRAPSALRRSLLDPTGTMRPIDRPVEIVTDDGERFDGRRLNEDTYTVQIIDDQGRLRSFDKDRLQQFTVHTESPMPSYGDELERSGAGGRAGVSRFPQAVKGGSRQCSACPRARSFAAGWLLAAALGLVLADGLAAQVPFARLQRRAGRSRTTG